MIFVIFCNICLLLTIMKYRVSYFLLQLKVSILIDLIFYICAPLYSCSIKEFESVHFMKIISSGA